MLLAVWDARRATVDADVLARDLHLNEDAILRRVLGIASLPAPVEDGVTFRVDTATAGTIRDGDLYGGVRVTMPATVVGADAELRLDISAGYTDIWSLTRGHDVRAADLLTALGATSRPWT